MKLPNTRPDENFFFSAYIPRPLISFNFLIGKFVYWYPWPFASLSFGWFGGVGPKVRALQFYIGIKADGTQSWIYNKVVMTYTFKECFAARVRLDPAKGVDVNNEWNNMGG